MSEPTITTQYRNKSNTAYLGTMTLYVALLVSLLLETWWWNPPPDFRLLISLLQIAPLFLPVAGLLRRSTRSASWLCFILCFYFISGVLSISAAPESPHGWLISVVCFLLFTMALFFIRWKSRFIPIPSSEQDDE